MLISPLPQNIKMATLGNEACDDSGGGGDGDDDVLPPSFLPPFPLPPWQIEMTPQNSVKGAQKTAQEALRHGR